MDWKARLDELCSEIGYIATWRGPVGGMYYLAVYPGHGIKARLKRCSADPQRAARSAVKALEKLAGHKTM